MASAYELMLVLRGRNYLSNDLRRAGSDLRRLQTQGGLQSQRSQLQINARRLASTRALAQAEMYSVTTGTRRLALDKAHLANKQQEVKISQSIRRAEESLDANRAKQIRKEVQISRLDRRIQGKRFTTNFPEAEVRKLREAAAIEQQNLMSRRSTINRDLETLQSSQTKVILTTQELTEREAALARVQQYLTEQINTTTAAYELNSQKLDENALAMKRLPFERFAAGATYVEHLGRTFQTFGLIATAALGAAAYSASKFQTQATLAATQATIVGERSVKAVQHNSAQIQKSVQDMLNRGTTAVKPTDLTQGLYSVYSGITLKGNQREQINQGINIIKQFSRVYTANYGQVEFNDVVKAGIALINNFDVSGKQLPGVLNRMQASVRFGALTMSEFVGSLNQVVPAFRGAHLGFDQMSADIAFVSRLFPSLRVGTTGLARLTETLGRAKVVAGIKQNIGVDIAPGGKLLPISDAVQRIVKARPELAKTGTELNNFLKTVSGSEGTVQARRVFVAYATHLALYHKLSRQVLGDNQELNKSFRDMSQTPQVRWAEFTNQLRGLILTIGGQALPVFAQMAKPVERAVRWFNSLSDSTKKNIAQWAAWAAIGMLVGGTVLIVVGAFGRMGAAIGKLMFGRAGLRALSEEGFIGAGTALRAGLVGALILAIPLLIRYHTQVGHVVNALGGMKTILGLIVTISGAWQIAKIIQGIAKIGGAAVIADGEVTALRASLLGLSTMSIAVPIVLTVVGSAALIKLMHWAGKGIPNAVRGRHDSAPLPGDPHKWSTNMLEAMTLAGPNTPYYKAHPGLYDQYYRILAHRNQGKNTSGMSNDPMHDVASGRPTLQQARANLPTPTVASFNQAAAIANVEKLRKAAEKAPSVKNYLAYEQALSALQKHYSGDQLTALNDYLNAIESTEKKSNHKRLSEAKKAAKEMLDAAKTLQSQYQSAYQANQTAFGQLFQGPFVNSPGEQNRLQYGGKLTGRDLMADLRSQVKQFKQWRGLLSQLRKRGITGDLYDQIVQAGPGSIEEVKALLSLSKADLRSYAKTFAASENLIAGATKQDMSISLTRYRKYGRNIALQIIQGLRDEHTPVLRVFEDMIIKDFPGLAKRAKSHTKPNHPPTRTTSSAKTEQHTHYHVVAPRTEHSSINTQLRHAVFASKTKHLKKPLP